MSIKDQFKMLTVFFEHETIEYALIGAFALYAYGYTRATRDIDFITRFKYQDSIVSHLESLGFETLNRSEGFSNHLHPVGPVRIDLVYIDDQTADIVLGSAVKKVIFDDLDIPVVSAEHLIALKLFAISNDPGRKFKELADIKEIFERSDLDRKTVRDYFIKYGLEEYYEEITARL